jgi:D12 class N6 adenine-specific DNA methyltransferase
MLSIKAPFPYFGGKSRVAHIVWDRFGDVPNYVEPFAGSLAVLLARPTDPRTETVNDLDCMIANFWRALQCDPGEVARFADWPVNEADLHARHLWLTTRREFRERMKTDPEYFDAQIAGWWVWGICQWIGSGWCATSNEGGLWRKRSNLDGRGTHSAGITHTGPMPITADRTNAERSVRGIHTNAAPRQVPHISRSGGMGVHRQLPDLSGDSGATGRGIHASGMSKDATREGLVGWFQALSERLRRVRVCCGDWRRVLGSSPTTCIGITGVFLDPPYSEKERADVYAEESRDVAPAVREWALENGHKPDLRIALCGYAGEHEMPTSWSVVEWKAHGGFGNQANQNTRGRVNAHRERIWFSPHCLRRTQYDLFE